MSLNNVPSSERTHIGIFGKRNAGKSSVINAITGQNLAIVSDIKGTTTDPVLKSMELLPLGPVVLIDTPGLDDEGDLGHLRIQKAYQILNKTDIALLVIDGTAGMTAEDYQILDRIRAKNIPYLIVFNKADLAPDADTSDTADAADAANVIWVSAVTGLHIQELKERLATLLPDEDSGKTILGDLIRPSDFIVLVVPIDKAAPKGRLILPQQQTIRDILDHNAISIVVKETDLKHTLETLGKKPALVITDSQVFDKAAADTPSDIPLTSFSILFARYKGNLKTLVDGARMLRHLENGDKILISEGCTHHRQCDDIGTVKLPRLIRNYTGKELEFEFTSGTEFPFSLEKYRLIVHCGGCMLNEREMKYRIRCAEDAGIPITNYGTAIACMKGILERSIEIFS
ncbi:[FeFe] hydrogenase H-cluster maturation GTPase HydF [Mordavella massiliensis]|uniref:[FeFe] hydrogenase H-cluster maturation GTPase HydF n=1 Tax=Mordavella massiliensis TaxID=1871024 RepID=A0A939BAQ8_9CLOT|nr:[FeFe] hydrogenase H-cluster maturation GTPase HydF [Mordavella massiliensis]MBM6827048.1 [FeFe] hydrogenase H-cluster maturation GTPase HydF [Mordavella massiliensis]